MSKLEDKLSASIKNERNTTAKPKSSAAKTPAKSSAPKASAEKPAKTSAPANTPAKTAARKSGGSKLHPKRVWPD